MKFAVPRLIVLVVLHEPCLRAEGFAFLAHGAVAESVQLCHLLYLLRDRPRRRHAGRTAHRERGFFVALLPHLGQLACQHDRRAAAPAAVQRAVKQLKDNLLVAVVVHPHADPFIALHMERFGKIGSVKRGKRFPAAFDVAALRHRAAHTVPFAHQKRRPLARGRIAQHGKALEGVPFTLLGDMIFSLGISRQLR